MRFTILTLALVVTIAIAMVAGRGSGQSSRSDVALRAKIAQQRTEIERLRGVRAGPDGEQPAASVAPIAVVNGGDASLPFQKARNLLRSADRAEQAAGFAKIELLGARDEKITLLREVLERVDPRMKSRALSLLRTLGGSDSVELVIGVLEKEGPAWLRSQAASVLGDLGNAAALGPLMNACGEESLQVRAGAAAALDQLGQPAPLGALIASLDKMLDDADSRKREEAIDLLSNFRTPAACPTLVKALGDRTNSRVREAAAEAIGQARLVEAVRYLEWALEDPEPRVRKAAQHALEEIRQPGK